MDANFEKHLSSEQLLASRNEKGKAPGSFSKFRVGHKVKRLPKSGEKREELNAILASTLELKFEAIEKKRLKLRKDMGEAVYSATDHSIRMTNFKGKPSFMGTLKDGEIYLSPEQALFLMESEAIQMLCSGIPLSIQEAFSMFLKSSAEFNSYKVYSYLSRYGFKLKQHAHKDGSFDISNCVEENPRKENKINIDSEEMSANYEKFKCSCDKSETEVLTKEMFVGSCDDEFFYLKNKNCKNWTEIKELSKKKKDHSYFSRGLVMREPCAIHSKCFAGGVSSVRNISEITTAEELYKKLKDSGPTTHSSNHKNSKLEICFDCYLPSNKRTSDAADFHIIIIDANDDPPMITDIIGVANQSYPVELLFAVIRDAEFNFYKFTPFECWDEIPVFWQSLNAQ